MTTVRFHDLAEKELWDALEPYDGEREGLGAVFLEEIERSLAFIARFPRAAPVARGSTRSFVVARFPSSLVFKQLGTRTIRILAVAHHKRRPGYWRGRQ